MVSREFKLTATGIVGDCPTSSAKMWANTRVGDRINLSFDVLNPYSKTVSATNERTGETTTQYKAALAKFLLRFSVELEHCEINKEGE